MISYYDLERGQKCGRSPAFLPTEKSGRPSNLVPNRSGEPNFLRILGPAKSVQYGISRKTNCLFRSRFGSLSLKQGIPTWRIRLQTGHSSDMMLNRYIRLANKYRDGQNEWTGVGSLPAWARAKGDMLLVGGPTGFFAHPVRGSWLLGMNWTLVSGRGRPGRHWRALRLLTHHRMTRVEKLHPRAPDHDRPFLMF